MMMAYEHSIPKRYRLITIFTGTAIIGVLLIFLAVHNASRDLELVHDVNALHGLIQASLTPSSTPGKLLAQLEHLSGKHYQVHALEHATAESKTDSVSHQFLPLDTVTLEASRVNDKGGYFESAGKVYTWAMLPLPDTNTRIVLIHLFEEAPPGVLAAAFSKRLLIPGIFYVWLMVWVALIIRFLLTKLDQQNKELEHLALYDNLTGLANRNLFEDRLHMMIEDCRRHKNTFALVNLDLNRFKQVNDTYGHEQGDELLRQFADRAKDTVRTSDTLARIGGDEFIMLLPDMDTETCACLCERFRGLVTIPYRLSRAEVSLGLSVGVAIFPVHGEDPATLMRYADQAMYVSKSRGGGISIHKQNPKESEGGVITENSFA